MPADRNGSGPFRLNGGVEGVEAPAPAPETGSLPLYPPIAESTLGKVNIVIFSGNCEFGIIIRHDYYYKNCITIVSFECALCSIDDFR